jgi:hypothetical protein
MSYKQMLSISADAKTIKGQTQGYLTGILYLAPADMAGYKNVCPFAIKAGCYEGCLNTAGRGAFSNVQTARFNKTAMFFENKELFFYNTVKSIIRLIKRAIRLNLIPVVRLNGTSDIQWENESFSFDGIQYDNIMAMFPDVQFYDYTKIPTRKNIPTNYDLTFSYSGIHGFQAHYNKAKQNPVYKRFAVVFDKAQNIPTLFDGMKTIDGDKTDLRFLDGVGIVALYAKGKAKKDLSGFVVKL